MVVPSPLRLTRLTQPILHTIFHYLPPSDIAHISTLSAYLDYVVAAYWSRLIWSLAAIYVSNVPRLLQTMRDTGAVLSGSALLSTLYQTQWRPNDLDIYCSKTSFDALVGLFVNGEKYTRLQLPPPSQGDLAEEEHLPNYIDHPRISEVAHLTNGTLKVDIVRSASSSALEPISLFWMTAVQNFASADHICVTYPTFTDQNLALLAPYQLVDMQYPSQAAVQRAQKYEGRGLRLECRVDDFEDSKTCEATNSVGCPCTVRYFGDRHCVTMHLNPIEDRMQDPISLAELRMQNVYWWRGGVTCGSNCSPAGFKVWPGALLKTDNV